MPRPQPNLSPVVAALNFCDPRCEDLECLTDLQWGNLLALCDETQLTISLRRMCGDFLPLWVQERIDQNISDSAQRHARIKTIYLELASALKAAHTEHLVLKGFSHIPDFAEDPRHRMQTDIDLYCPPESVLRARDALANIGYTPYLGFEHQPIDHLPPMVRKTNWLWSGNHFDPEMPVSVDLHFRFWNEKATRLRLKGLDQFWARHTERRLDDFSFPALNSVDSIAYAALHVFHHLTGSGLATYHVYELASFLHAKADNVQFWQEWRNLHEDSLRRVEAVCFQLAVSWFACRIPGEVQGEIDRLPAPVKQWFPKYARSPSAWMHPNKDALWLHLSMLESSGDKALVFGAGLFPVRIPPVSAIRQWSLREYGRFSRHVASRIGYHLRCFPRTLWQGLRWHESANGLTRQFWIFFAASSLFDIGLFIFFFLYNLFLLDYGYTERFLGQVTSANAVGGIAGALPAAVLAHRFGLRKTMLVCLALVVALSASLALFVSAIPQLCFAFLASAASTAWSVCAAPAVAQLTTEQNRPLGFSVTGSTGIGLGVVASLAGGNLPGWLARVAPSATAGQLKQGALLIACAVVAVALWPVSRLHFDSLPAPEKKIYPRNPFVFRFLAAITVWSFAASAFTPFFNAYCAQHLHMPLPKIGAVFSASQLASMLAILAAPLLFRKVGLVAGILYTQVVAALALGCLARTTSIPGATTFYVGYAAFLWMSEPGMFTLLMNGVDPSERSGASALNLLAMSLAGAIAAPLAGALFARYGYPAVLGVLAGITLCAAGIFRLFFGQDTVVVRQPVPDRLGS